MNRRKFLKLSSSLCLISAVTPVLHAKNSLEKANLPNILFCISDDQSYAHAGANGDKIVQTPAFDRVAQSGLCFDHAFCNAPTCAPSRSAILTGQSIWRLEEAGNIHSTLPAKFATYPALLKEAGYMIGHTGKGWAPGRFEVGGWTENPAGPVYIGRKLKKVRKGIRNMDYAGAFEDFLNERPKDQPFCFWLGTSEPHRGYAKGAGARSGKDPDKVVVPSFLPDNDIVRNDILDYYMEIEHFDKMVDRAVKSIKKRGLLKNTIIVVTSDQGFPFPRGKATLYDAGSRSPLAISWLDRIREPGRRVKSFVNLSDLAPTFLEAAHVKVPKMMNAQSMLDIFDNKEKKDRSAAYIGFERHDGCRKGGKGYPCRAIRTVDYLYILNYKPDRMPSGSPDASDCARAIPYGEIDSSPTKQYMMNNRDKKDVDKLAALAFDKRPADELYRIKTDPHQIKNLAANPEYKEVLKKMKGRLMKELKRTKDPRITGGAVLWDYYPYYGRRRNKDWKVDPLPGK